MSDLRVNLSANIKRYTTKKNRAEYLAKIAAYTAISYILYVLCKFSLPMMFPSFLDIQISELPALIAGFSMGPISGCLVIVLKCLLKLPLSGTMFVGEATDILLGICFVLPSSLIYNARKNKITALIGLIVGSVLVTIMSIIVNRFISIPFYVEVMFGGSFAPLINMMSALYKDITVDNFYFWYLLVGILPFNILRCAIVSAVTYLLYPRLQRPLRLEITDIPEPNDCYVPDNPCDNHSAEKNDGEEEDPSVENSTEGESTEENQDVSLKK